MTSKALKSAKEEQQELEALHRLDEECVYQQQAGDYLKAFDCMERALVLRRHFFGADSPEVLHACKALAEMCNLLSMSFLQQDNYAVTIDLLKKAEILTKHHPPEKATTLNNLACYYRRLGKLHAAMTCLKRALELEKKLQNVRNAADTHLNLCAVLSQLGKHPQALEQAQEALIILQEEFFQSKQTTGDTVVGKAKKKPGHDDEEVENGDTAAVAAIGSSPVASCTQQIDRVSVMCIAYHNIGVEQEFLKDYANSVMSYKKGVGLAEQYLGVDHAITTTVRNSYLAAKRTISTKSAGRTHRGASLSGGGSLDLPLASKSPGRVSIRLLNSPRSSSNSNSLTNSLRLPSPLTKEKQRHDIGDILSPRSIVADVLSKGATLPPLDPGRSPMRGGVLSPRGPFFSPRFRFDGDGGEHETGGGASGSKSPMPVKKIKKKEIKFETSLPPSVMEPELLVNNNSATMPEMELAIESPPPIAPGMDLQVEKSPISIRGDLSSVPQDLIDNLSIQAESSDSHTQGAPGEMHSTVDTERTNPANLVEDSPASAFQQEESPTPSSPVVESPFSETSGGDETSSLADFGENTRDIGGGSATPEADGVPADRLLGPDPTFEEPSPFADQDKRGVTASLQDHTVDDPDANKGSEPISSSAVLASDESVRSGQSTTVPTNMSVPVETDGHEPDVQIGNLDSPIEDIVASQVDSESLSASARMAEYPASDESKGFEELVAPLLLAPSPDHLSVTIATHESVSLDNAEELRENDERGKEEILDLFDESVDDGVHSMDRQEENSMSTSELLVSDPTNSDEAMDENEEPSVPEKIHVESVEAEQSVKVVENASDSLVIDEPSIIDTRSQDGDASIIAPALDKEVGEQAGTDHNTLTGVHDGEVLDTDQCDASDSEAFVYINGEIDAGEAYEVHAESAMDELIDSEYYSDHGRKDKEGECRPYEEHVDTNWNSEIDTVHSSKTATGHTTDGAPHEELPAEDNFALEADCYYEHHPIEEQPTFYHHDDDDSELHLPQSEYADASNQDTYESAGEHSSHHEEVEPASTPSEFEDYHQVAADTEHDEIPMEDTYTEKNPSPDPAYDAQFEFEYEAGEEDINHLQGYAHDPNESIFVEYSSTSENVTAAEEHEIPVSSGGDATAGSKGLHSQSEHDMQFASELEHHDETEVGSTQIPTVLQHLASK